MRRVAVALSLVMIGVLASAGPAVAGQKTGCPVADGWEELTVEQAAAIVWPELVDQSPWTDQHHFQESAVRPYDRNGDDSICLRTIWENLNPESNWYGVLTFLPRDNNSNGSNR